LTIVVATILIIYLLNAFGSIFDIYKLLLRISIWNSLKLKLFKLAMKFPLVKRWLNNEERKLKDRFTTLYSNLRKNVTYKMPDDPMKDETILARMEEGKRAADIATVNGT
jgi:hypothetical protein